MNIDKGQIPIPKVGLNCEDFLQARHWGVCQYLVRTLQRDGVVKRSHCAITASSLAILSDDGIVSELFAGIESKISFISCRQVT